MHSVDAKLVPLCSKCQCLSGKSANERKESEGWRQTESARGKQRGKGNGTSDERNEDWIEGYDRERTEGLCLPPL